jgi:hypothetical protein
LELEYIEATPAEFGVRIGLLLLSYNSAEMCISQEKTCFSHVVSCDEIAPHKILLLKEIQG